MLITSLDGLLIGVALISAFLAASRGLIRVILSIICCAAAEVVTALSYSVPLSFMKQYLGENVALALVINAVFFGFLIVFLVAAARISHVTLDARVSALDGALGFLFGLGRGLIVFTVAFLIFEWLVPERAWPDWIRNAKSLVVLQATGAWLISQVPEFSDNKILAQLFGLILTPVAVFVDFCAIIVRLAGYQVPVRSSVDKTGDGGMWSGYTRPLVEPPPIPPS